MYVYKVTNLINGKYYIGKTTQTLRTRRSQHIADMNRNRQYYFIRALRKYGVESFDWSIIDTCSTPEELNEREIYWIDKLNSKNRYIGYNVADGGKGGGNRAGVKLSEETCKKISVAKLGTHWGNHSEETKQRMSECRIGIEFSETHKQNLSIARKKRVTTDDTRVKMSLTSTGKINIKRYQLISPDGMVYITDHGLSQFCRDYNLSASNLMKVLSGERLHHKGWKISKIE